MKRMTKVWGMLCLAGLLISLYLGVSFLVPKQGKIILTFGMFSGNQSDVPNDDCYKIIDETIKEFEKEYPNVKVKYTSGILKEDYSEWLSNQALNGALPDVFMVLPEDFTTFASIGILKNLETMLNTKVMDRTLIILDIFAARATTSEGKIQVELAQLKYRLSRLTGLGRSMSRLGGGIGTRGPGEKKLEIDRRLINDRIAQLNRELKEVVKHREIARAKRERNAVPVVAIVGYTNAGKSTLLNHLTDAEVLEEDKLFATLDPTTRMLELEGHQQVLLTDTVGFIRKLPHHLIEAFKSTLEEAKYADYIIHVVDASNPQRDKQMYIVYETLDHLGVKNKKILTLFNKIDIRTDDDPLQDFRADHVLQISATENAGLDAVKDVLQEMLREDKIYIERVIPYAQAGVLQLVRNKGELVSEEYVPEGISIRAYVPMEVYGKL